MAKKEKTKKAEDKKRDIELENEEQTLASEAQETENNQSERISEVEELQIKYNELNDKFIRLYSEYDNFRRRTAKEKNELILTGTSSIMSDLLSTLDDFERAIQHNEKVEEADSIKEGFLLIYNKFKKTLENKGLEPMESKEKSFDDEHHEAVANFPVEDETKKGMVIDVVEKGYFLNGKVLRHAKVVVGQ